MTGVAGDSNNLPCRSLPHYPTTGWKANDAMSLFGTFFYEFVNALGQPARLVVFVYRYEPDVLVAYGVDPDRDLVLFQRIVGDEYLAPFLTYVSENYPDSIAEFLGRGPVAHTVEVPTQPPKPIGPSMQELNAAADAVVSHGDLVNTALAA